MSDQEQIITAPCGDCIEGSRIDGDRAIKCRNGIVPMCAHVALKDRNAALEQMATDAVFAGAQHKKEVERLEKELDTQRQGLERLNIEQANEIEGLKKELAEAADKALDNAMKYNHAAERIVELKAENARLDACLEDVGDILYDYDGCKTEKCLKELIDEAYKLARSKKPIPTETISHSPEDAAKDEGKGKTGHHSIMCPHDWPGKKPEDYQP